jgi:hypothetical protein
MHSFADYLWFAAVAIGPLLLAGMIAYALLKRRSLNGSEQLRRDQAIDRVYQNGPPSP